MTKILLVEDNDINRDMLSRRLERKGYEVIVAINGAEGLNKTQSDRPDLILMDLNLPVLDGWEATRKIKANPQTRAIPVIALTANAIAGEREKALAAGCDEYETKPVQFPQLLEKIAKLLAPPALQPAGSLSSNPDLPADPSLLRSLRICLRREFDAPIYSIIGYSNLLLDAMRAPQNLSLYSDVQKIHISAMQLLKLVQVILDPVLVDIQQQDLAIDLFASALRRELLTPLSTVIGYCEILIEEASADFIPDLKQIYALAQELLSMVSSLNSLMMQLLQSIQAIEMNAEPSERPIKPETRRSALIGEHRILVIDSSESSCTVLSRQLERQGYQVAIATTAQQAIQFLAAMPCNLVLLEVSQPAISSLQILEQIKSHETWQQIPVLLIAAPDEVENVVQGIEIGAADYLLKPFQPVLLRSKIAAYLEQGQLWNQVEALQLELEQLKRGQQAVEIVQTQYFQQLQPNVQSPETPLKVLLVEDNELNCDMLSRRLQRQGYEIVIAHDGAEGVSKALSEQPDIILMDISLPVMDGCEATQKLKIHPETCRIPVIALTAHAMTGDREKALAAGCDDYDTKPIELSRLLSKLERCLKRAASSDNSSSSDCF